MRDWLVSNLEESSYINNTGKISPKLLIVDQGSYDAQLDLLQPDKEYFKGFEFTEQIVSKPLMTNAEIQQMDDEFYSFQPRFDGNWYEGYMSKRSKAIFANLK